MIRQPSKQALRKWHLVVLAAGTFILGMDGLVLTGLLPQISSDLSVSVAVTGQLTTIFAITYAIGSPLIATATGRWDRRILLSAGLTVFLLGMVAQALGPTFAVVAVGRVFAAIGAAAFQANAYAVAGALAEPERRGRALAAVTAGASVSTIIGVPFGVLIGEAIGWRGAMWIIAGLAACVAIVVPFVPRVAIPPTSLSSRLRVLTHRSALSVFAGTILVLMPLYLLVSYLPLVLQQSHSSGALLVIALLVVGLGQLAGNRIVGRSVDTRGALTTVLTGVIGVTVACAAIIAVQFWYPPFLIALLLLGAFAGLTLTPQQHRIFALLPNIATVALGLNGSAIYAGAAIGAGLGGLVAATAGPIWLPVTATILGATAILFIWRVAPEKLEQLDIPTVA